MEMHLARTLPQPSPLESFVAEFHATLARHAGTRLTRQNEILIRGLIGSLVRRAFMRGVLPADTRLLATRTPDGMVFRVFGETGPIAEGLMRGSFPRPRRRKPRLSAASPTPPSAVEATAIRPPPARPKPKSSEAHRSARLPAPHLPRPDAARTELDELRRLWGLEPH